MLTSVVKPAKIALFVRQTRIGEVLAKKRAQSFWQRGGAK
jgi:hypothetical protein